MLASVWVLAAALALAPAAAAAAPRAEGQAGSEAEDETSADEAPGGAASDDDPPQTEAADDAASHDDPLQTGTADDEGPPPPEGSARLVFAPGPRGTIAVIDERGREVATVALHPERRTVVELPPGEYTLRDGSGQAVKIQEPIVVEPDQVRGVELPPAFRVTQAPGPKPPARGAKSPARERRSDRLGPPSPQALHEAGVARRRPWARWVAPLLSAVVPGGGQAINGQPGRGLAVFTGTVGLVLGTVAVGAARDPMAGAGGRPGPGRAEEIVRLGALAGLSTAAGLLYLGQILDAHAHAVGRRRPRPLREHQVSLELSRFTTVAFAPGQPRYDLYSDWSLAIMGQVAPRVTVGLSDASIKYARHRDMLTVQAGARAAYRFFDRKRVWLAAGGGALVQGTRATPSLEALVEDPDAPLPDAERGFSVAPYVHLDARLFLLDRWSLGLMPRLGLPLQPRRTQGGRALPRYAATFELGANLGVLF